MRIHTDVSLSVIITVILLVFFLLKFLTEIGSRCTNSVPI